MSEAEYNPTEPERIAQCLWGQSALRHWLCKTPQEFREICEQVLTRELPNQPIYASHARLVKALENMVELGRNLLTDDAGLPPPNAIPNALAALAEAKALTGEGA